MKNRNYENIFDQDLFDRVSGVICSVMAGDYTLSGKGYGGYYDTSATFMLLDNIAEGLPGIFKNKDFIIGLLHNIVRVDKSECFYDSLLSRFFIGHVDDSLKSDKDVVMYFIYSLFSAPDALENESSGYYEQDILEFCRAIPHELLMDSEVFSAVLEKANPIGIYTELLTDEEKVDEHIVFKILWAFMRYCRYRTSDRNKWDAEDFKKKGLYELQESWIEAVEAAEKDYDLTGKFHDMEEADFIGELDDGIYSFFNSFFGFLMKEEFLVGYKGVEPGTIREKSDLYLQYLRDTREEDIDREIYLPDSYYMDCPYACDYLMGIVKKYWYQICLFGAVGTDYHNMLTELCGGYVHKMSDVSPAPKENSDGESGEFFNVPCDDFEDGLPF